MLCVVLSGELAVCCCCAWFVCEFVLLILVGGFEVSENGNFWEECQTIGGYNGYTIVWSKNAKSVWVCVTIFVFSVF